MPDVGLSHIALPVADVETSVQFYQRYARMRVVHSREDRGSGWKVVWIGDGTRPFVIVLLQGGADIHPLLPDAHLGVACRSRGEVDRLCEEARREGCLLRGPQDAGPPVGYWALLRDPDGHTLELSFGQEIARTVSTSPSTSPSGVSSGSSGV